jgi:hypothetical protein
MGITKEFQFILETKLAAFIYFAQVAETIIIALCASIIKLFILDLQKAVSL